MDKVYSRQEARDWFIENHSGSVICVGVIDCDEKVADCFPVADKFYQQIALLSKYRSVTSVSTEELIEIKEVCDELGISIHEALPNIWNETGKGPINDKSHNSHAVDRIIFKPTKWQKDLIKEFPKLAEPKEKVTLIFENGSTVELTEKNDMVVWKGVIGMMIEEWLSLEEAKKRYPEAKIK